MEQRRAFRDELRGILRDLDTVDRYARELFAARERERRTKRDEAV